MPSGAFLKAESTPPHPWGRGARGRGVGVPVRQLAGSHEFLPLSVVSIWLVEPSRWGFSFSFFSPPSFVPPKAAPRSLPPPPLPPPRLVKGRGAIAEGLGLPVDHFRPLMDRYLGPYLSLGKAGPVYFSSTYNANLFPPRRNSL